jgi:hypothetical protein
MGDRLGGSSPWGEGGGNLQTDAAQLFLFVPIPAKAKMLGLLSIYKFSLIGIIEQEQEFYAFLQFNDISCFTERTNTQREGSG